MTWTTKVPEKPGLYWYLEDEEGYPLTLPREVEPIELEAGGLCWRMGSDIPMRVYNMSGEWWDDPLAPPTGPTPCTP